MSAVSAFDAGALEQRYTLLDRLPESLFHAAATHLHGTLRERVDGLLQWHDALLKGALPELDGLKWPDRSSAELIRAELTALRLPHFCQGEKSLVEALLLDVLEAASTGILPRSEWQAQLLQQLREQRGPRVRRKVSGRAAPAEKRGQGASGTGHAREREVPPGEGASASGGGTSPGEGSGDAGGVAEQELDAETLAELEAEASRLADLRVADSIRKRLRSPWEERVRLWADLEDVFGELAMLLGRGWDLTRGLLRSQGWLEVVRLRELLERLPALRELVRVLGRMQTSEDPNVPPVMESIIGPLRRIFEERREVYSPLARSETRGIERSDDVQRMLPFEAALLGHPVLRLLWHARRAERALLTYRVEGLDFERVQVETEVHASQQHVRPAETRGPILICLDTSGSMEGTPEVVAKALVLEAMRVAFGEKRACYLYAFSGPGDVAEHALEMTEAGLTRLMAFLTQSFSGGTDVTAPLVRAVSKLDAEGWERADLLLVSDGEFAVPPATRELLTRASSQKGLRSHGLLIGAGEGAAMAAICSPVHRFNDWSVLLGNHSAR
ncbi:VWA domain-containing protein [Myxococcus sp. RHSTA-1-4]|uniref:VWA domain-containing protein n=1 Tax=Myxococcus sp. RHSTA-1-4 TaxID=2874601 RepID=UPI001CBE47EB|nr:VWA domain-containing protein [Myxococcus sp. RHSTA-1-4]MBZ4416500.1 VWA domain-containing protein [Myxococcus sp. RHSTA-1-4]